MITVPDPEIITVDERDARERVEVVFGKPQFIREEPDGGHTYTLKAKADSRDIEIYMWYTIVGGSKSIKSMFTSAVAGSKWALSRHGESSGYTTSFDFHSLHDVIVEALTHVDRLFPSEKYSVTVDHGALYTVW